MVSQTPSIPECDQDTVNPDEAVVQATPSAPDSGEIGGRGGPDPTRYGDWEKNGRCIDF